MVRSMHVFVECGAQHVVVGAAVKAQLVSAYVRPHATNALEEAVGRACRSGISTAVECGA